MSTPVARDPAIRRHAVIIALVAVVPPWLWNVLMMTWLLGFADADPMTVLRSWATPWLVLVPLVALALDLGLIALLVSLGEFRSDRWWLAGASFVGAALLATVAVDGPSAGDAVFLELTLSMLTGHWVLTFALGALAWRRLAGRRRVRA